MGVSLVAVVVVHVFLVSSRPPPARGVADFPGTMALGLESVSFCCCSHMCMYIYIYVVLCFSIANQTRYLRGMVPSRPRPRRTSSVLNLLPLSCASVTLTLSIQNTINTCLGERKGEDKDKESRLDLRARACHLEVSSTRSLGAAHDCMRRSPTLVISAVLLCVD